MTTEPIDLRRTRDFGDVLNAAFYFIRQNALPLGRALLFVVGPMVLVMALLSTVFQDALGAFTFPSAGAVPPEELFGFDWGRLATAVVLLTTLSVVLITLTYAVVLSYIGIYETQPAAMRDVGEIWRWAKRYLVRIFGLTLTVGAAAVFGAVINLIPCLGTLAWFAGVIYLTVLGSLANMAIVQEDLGVFAALGRAKELMAEHFWVTLALLIVSSLVAMILSFLVGLPVFVLQFTWTTFVVDGGEPGLVYSALYFLFNAVATLVSTVLYAFPLTVMALQYFSLVEQKERVGLMGRVEGLRRRVDAVAPGADASASGAAPPAATDEPADPVSADDAGRWAPPAERDAPPSGSPAAPPPADPSRWAPPGTQPGAQSTPGPDAERENDENLRDR